MQVITPLQKLAAALGGIARTWRRMEQRGLFSPHVTFIPSVGPNRHERRKFGALMRKMSKVAKREQEAKTRWLESLYPLAASA